MSSRSPSPSDSICSSISGISSSIHSFTASALEGRPDHITIKACDTESKNDIIAMADEEVANMGLSYRTKQQSQTSAVRTNIT